MRRRPLPPPGLAIPAAALLLGGCAIPTTYGLRTDGLNPEPGDIQVTAFAGSSHGLEDGVVVGGGGDVELPLSDRFSLDLGGAAFHVPYRLGGGGVGELRYRLGKDRDAPVNASLLGGVGVSTLPHRAAFQVGLHAGGLTTLNLDPVRLYMGGKVNVAAGDWIGGWVMATGGLSFRPSKPLVLGAEGTLTFDTDGDEPAIGPLLYGGLVF